jgi:catechol 2,3-dioxygenase-like lactoylglutathione lyase family enzyme
MKTSLRHVGIVVRDLEKAIKFWENNFGFEVRLNQIEKGSFIENLLNMPGVCVQTVKLSCSEETEIELLKFDSVSLDENWDGNVDKIGLTHIALNVVNLDKILSNLLKEGYSPFQNPQISENGVLRVCYIEVLEGLLLELVEKITE